MASFNVLYTHQKTKKAKVWQDGVLSVVDSSKREIFDTKGNRIDCLYSTKQVSVGDEYETEKYLIMVDSHVTSSTDHVTQPNVTASDVPRPRPVFSNKLAGSKSRKGFNPPKRLPAVHTEEEPSPKLQQVESSKSLSLFSTYSQLPTYKRVERAESPPASITAEPTSVRSVKDILSLISSVKSNDRRQPNGDVSGRYLPGINPGQIEQPKLHIPPTVDCAAPRVSGHCSSIGGSLWGDFLSQEADAQAKVLAGQSPRSDSHHGMTTPNNAARRRHTVDEFGAGESTMLSCVNEGMGGHSTSTGKQRKKLTATNSGKQHTESTDVPTHLPSSGVTRSSVAADRIVEPLSPLQTAQPTCHTSATSALPRDVMRVISNHSNKREVASRTTTAVVADQPGSRPSPHTHDSPQTANFSLGSLSTESEDDLSQSSSLDVPVAQKINIKHGGVGTSGQEKTTPIIVAATLQGKEPLVELLSVSEGRTSDKTCDPPTVPQHSNHVYDILKSCNVDDLYNTSLFDVDDSLNDSLRKDPPTPTTSSPSASNVWTPFTSPKKKPPQVFTHSIFDPPSPGSHPERVWLANGTDVGLGRSFYSDTCLLPPTPGSSVFGATLPADKVQLAREKVLRNVDKHSSRDVNKTPLPVATGSDTAETRKSMVDCWTLRFPGYTAELARPTRTFTVPISYRTTVDYKQTLEQLLREYINIVLLDLCMQYHEAMACVNITGTSPGSTIGSAGFGSSQGVMAGNPPCQHGLSSKMVEVRKEGANKGRMFYACSNSRAEQCKFFQWADQPQTGNDVTSSIERMKLCSGQAVEAYLKGKTISFYYSSRLNKHSDSFIAKRWSAVNEPARNHSLYLKLKRREKASAYTRGDVWVISQNLLFDLKGNTFIAKSVFYGPNSDNELELSPLAGYTSCNWPAGRECYAIHVPNLSTELVCLANLQDLNARTVPVLPWLIHSSGPRRTGGRFEIPTSSSHQLDLSLPEDLIMSIARTLIDKYTLNRGQAQSLMSVASMFLSGCTKPICLIRGVFGAGKSYLLSVIVQFIVKVLEIVDDSNQENAAGSVLSKVLISSMTNVAVDRVLLGLLEQDYADFLRVGSMKKIAKPILQYSLHASGNTNTELKELQDMLKEEELSPAEKANVRRGIAAQKSGINMQRLGATRVVGVTCAACSFPVLERLTFKVVLLDECSQMTEPLSLLPIKRAACSRLVLVGDPRQLKPTIQGSEPSHERGLEQTMFDRLALMGVPLSQLNTQYRCHPAISAISRELFYEGELEDGVTADQRPSLCQDMPAVCLYNVNGVQKFGGSISYYNDLEASFVSELISWLIINGVDMQQVGVITLYKAQVATIQVKMTQLGLRKVQVATVDSFQGAERDIIILSCVRTDQMGFADDSRRTNVALSRGKHHLFVVGHAENLRRNSLWCRIVSYLEDRSDGVINANEQVRKWQIAKRELSTSKKKSAKRKEGAGGFDTPGCKKSRSTRRDNSRLSGDEESLTYSPELDFGGQKSQNSSELTCSHHSDRLSITLDEEEFLNDFQSI